MVVTAGKYRLERRLGGGGMAEVFVAAVVGAEGFSRRVAIKQVLPGYSGNPQFAKMFVAEAKIISRLKHPNIVSVLDFDRGADNRLYLVMELVDGKDLDAFASTGPLPIPVIIFIISEALRGLGYAHDLPVVDESELMGSETVRRMKGVVHRDVSPHNVLVSWEGEVKLSDFGIAKARTADNATASELIKGKPSYMSPEQANGAQLDGRSDLFAIGVMLWELLCGRRLFSHEDTRATLAAVLFGNIPKPRSVRPDVPKDLERVAMKLLEREVDRRYATAEEAIADLMACDATAPDGREQLKRVLAERFPQEAPVRHSVMRGRSTPRQASATPVSQASHEQPTIRAGGPIPVSAIPSAANPSSAPAQAALPAQSARTRTAPGPAASIARTRSRWPLAVGGVLTVLVAIVAIAVVEGGGSARGSGAGSSAGGSSAPVGSDHPGSASPVAHAPVPAITPDAALVAAPVPTPFDAGALPPAFDAAAATATLDASVKDPTSKRPSGPAAPQKYGRLRVSAFPALTVFIDGRKKHDTPFEAELPVGRHVIRLLNRGVGHDETVTVNIQENQTKRIDRE